jgi:ATP-dependent RNA helicase DHX37/DHR1
VIEKVTRAHKKLPHGGILVFLTGQNEIKQVADRLRQELVPRSSSFTGVNAPRVQIAASEAPLEAEDMDVGNFEIKEGQDDFEIDILTQSDEEEEAHEFEVSDDEDGDEGETQSGHASLSKSTKEPYTSVHVLPLYSQLPTTEQLKVFEPAPLGARMIVLATNVAETSLTIPGMRYVFDTGRSKERKYNLDSGVQSFEIDYISKASAQQRAGRAGRTGPGHCWRLYTSAVYEQFFPEHAEPEILRAPAESVVLQLKGFEYPLPVANFPFPTPPAASSLNKAEQLLRNLGALTTEGKITDLGRQLSMYPLSPRLGRIMAAGVKDVSMIWQVLSLVSSLAVSEIFITEAQLNLDHRPSESTTTDNGDRVYTLSAQQDDEARDNLKQSFGRARATLSRHDKTSDVLKLFTAVSMYLDSPNKAQFCTDYFLRPKAMAEIAQLHSQLESLIRANHRSTITQETLLQSKTTKLSTSRAKLLNTIAASGHIDNLAIRWDMHPLPPDMTLATKPRRAIDVAYIPLIPLTSSSNDPLVDKVIYIHPSSILSRLPIKSLPEYIVYSQLQRSQPKTSSLSVNDKPKIRMFPLTPLDAAQISLLARDTALVEYGKPVRGSKVEDVPAGSTDSSTGTGTGGGSSSTRKKRIAWVTCEIRGGKGMTGWPLPPVKVRQVFDVKSRSGWRVEEVLS